MSRAIDRLAALIYPPPTPTRRTMIPASAPIIQLLRPATDYAVAKASHNVSPIKWHKRTGINPVDCEFCPSDLQEKIEADRQRILDEALDEMLPPGAVIAPWQRKLALEVLEAKSVEMDAVVDQAEVSPALQEYLDERGLVPDPPEVTVEDVDAVKAATRDDYGRHELVDFEVLTTKQLRPLASAAGMKGARVAKKDELVEFLAAQS